MNLLPTIPSIKPFHPDNFCEPTIAALHFLPPHPFLETFGYISALFAVSSLLVTVLVAKTVGPTIVRLALAHVSTRFALAKTFVANATIVLD